MAIMNQPPYGFVNRNRNKSGYFYDIVKTILNNARISKDIQLLPMKRLLKGVTAGVIDCTLVANTPTRGPIIVPSRPSESLSKRLSCPKPASL